MCIRDRYIEDIKISILGKIDYNQKPEYDFVDDEINETYKAVSYTHLTLPTSDLV